jgi:hypothetical protein
MKASILASTKKRGRPKTTGKGEQIGVRLLPPLLASLDALIATRPDPKPSRPEAIREILKATFKLIEDGNAAVRRNLVK